MSGFGRVAGRATWKDLGYSAGAGRKVAALSELRKGAERRARLLLALLPLMALTGSLGPPDALAAPAGAARLEVAAGYGGFHVPGRAVPVRVTISADRLLRGDLLAGGVGTTEGRVRLPVEVPGGSVKRYVLVLPPGTAERDGDVRVELRSSGRVLARGEGRLRPAEGQELVGLLPGVLAGRPVPGPAPLAVDAGLARFVALEPADLGRGAAALEALSAIGLAPDDLAALGPSARDGLRGWVAGGGRLLLDAEPGGALPGLPEDWQPGPGGRVAAGRGEVRLTAGAMAGGRWGGLVEPTPRGRFTEATFFSGFSIADTVARDAGLRLPRLVTLLGFLALYVLAVGPLTAVVLRRLRRPELAWVVVPALAVVFTLVSYGAGSGVRNGARIAHGSVVEIHGEAAIANTWVGLTRRGAGTARIDFPEGWAVRPASLHDGHTSLPGVELGGEGPQAEVPLDVGEFGVVRASGPVNLPGGVEVTADPDGDTRARGTVRNGLPFALEEVAVFVGDGVTAVGRLAPGEERAWSLDAGFGVGRFGGPEWFARFPGDGWSEGPAGRDGVVNLPLWQATQAEFGPEFAAPGTAVAVGWTRDWRPPIRLDGRSRSMDGRTAVVRRAPVAAGPGPLSALAVRREVVRGPFPSQFEWGGMAGPGGDETVARFTLPEPAAGDSAARALVLRSSLPLQSVEVWRDGVWQAVGVGAVPLPFPDARRFKLLPAPAAPPPPIVGPPEAVTTTTVAPAFPAVPATTAPAPAALPAPLPPAMPAPPAFPPASDVRLPVGVANNGVVFVRVRFDGGPGGGVVLTLGEAAP